MKKCKSCKAEIPSDAKKCSHCGTDQRGWFRKHPILTVLLIIFVIGIIGAVAGGGGDKSSTGTKQTSSQESKQSPEPKQVQEPMKITAQELADDFDSNQVAAENKWKGKLVIFSAEVTNITDFGLSFSEVSSKEFSMTQISCKVADKQQLLALKNGQNVTVEGIVGSQTIGVISINDCQIIQ